MSHLQSLTKKIQKHCPELLELSFGCWFMWKETVRDMEEEGYVARFENWRSKASGPYTIRCLTHLGQQGIIEEDHIIEILGHPIELQHVLRAMVDEGEINPFGGIPYPYQLAHKEIEELIWRWNLTKNLSGQSEDTLKFLDEIIK